MRLKGVGLGKKCGKQIEGNKAVDLQHESRVA
jgi:hypothetical protein